MQQQLVKVPLASDLDQPHKDSHFLLLKPPVLATTRYRQILDVCLHTQELSQKISEKFE
jgi:hypothetical protein